MVRNLIGATLAFLATGCSPDAPPPPDEPSGLVGSHLTWEPLPTGEVTRIALGSCAFQWEEQPIWDAVIAAKPDLFLYLGDEIYADFDGENTYDVSAETLEQEWGVLAARPEFRRLAESVPVMAAWDNHDYGRHDGGAEFPLKDVSKAAFLDFLGEPPDSERRSRDGIYDARVFGPEGRRVQVILLDTRYFKGPYELAERAEGAGGSLGKFAPNPDPTVTLLGEEQWAWLEEQLSQPAEIRLIASSTQIVADQKGMDEWGNYPHERSRLFELIASTGAEGVVLLSGNVHFSEVSSTDEGPYRLHDFTASGLTHVNEGYAEAPNPYRVAGPVVEINFGLIEIDWAAESGPLVHLKVVGVDHSIALEYTIPVPHPNR